ncbi:MAG: lipoate--protein ligase family protein [Lachnospiraceae bacterium]|nr:lipoate--protein ligase family protein [Lachnospiraceae bacterium]
MRFSYVISDSTDPYHNLAAEQELMEYTASGLAVIFLWQNDNTIVVGRNQNVYSECRAEDFVRSGGRIARRRSGGGAVYHDLGNLNFSILSKQQDRECCSYTSLILGVMERLGLKADYNGRNDILISGKKISGNATYHENENICQHGTILIDTDAAKISEYLTPDRSKLERNHIKSIASRVTNLSSLGYDITVDRVRQAFIEVTGADRLDARIDKERQDALEEFYKSDIWIYEGRR